MQVLADPRDEEVPQVLQSVWYTGAFASGPYSVADVVFVFLRLQIRNVT
jgi:hypothetical protein